MKEVTIVAVSAAAAVALIAIFVMRKPAPTTNTATTSATTVVSPAATNITNTTVEAQNTYTGSPVSPPVAQVNAVAPSPPITSQVFLPAAANVPTGTPVDITNLSYAEEGANTANSGAVIFGPNGPYTVGNFTWAQSQAAIAAAEAARS